MSGGSFDYAYARMARFADELRNKLDAAGREDRYGYSVEQYAPEISQTLTDIANLAEYVGKLAKEAEWLYSGDTGEETFMERVRKIGMERIKT